MSETVFPPYDNGDDLRHRFEALEILYRTVAHDLEAAQSERNILQGQLDDCSEQTEQTQHDALMQVLIEMRMDLAHIRGTLERIDADLERSDPERSGAVSGVKIHKVRGQIEIECLAFAGSDIEGARQEAVRAYRDTIFDLNRQGVDAFGQTVALLKETNRRA